MSLVGFSARSYGLKHFLYGVFLSYQARLGVVQGRGRVCPGSGCPDQVSTQPPIISLQA